MVSASSWSLIEGSEIFFTITECPLTAVATALALIWLSVNSFEIAVDTELADKAVSVITQHARTGQIGDGKIFVTPIDHALRIRTGETDNDAL